MTPPYRTHYEERAWIEAHRDEYLGQWVALDGDRLIAHGSDAKKVYGKLGPRARLRRTLLTLTRRLMLT